MNVTQLEQPPPQTGPTRSASEAEDITPDFLSIRLVNKRTRTKLSPEPLDLTPIPNKGQLFVVASTLGWFVAIIRSSTGLALVASPLADLRSHLSSLDPNSDNAFPPQRKIPFSSVTPNHLVFALNDSKLVVGLTHGPVIVFKASDICSPGDNEVSPLHTFLPTTPAPTAVRQMYANPGDIPELVAILRESDGGPNSQLVEVINVSTMQSVAGWSAGGTPETFPTSISWSPKGKQLAIALQSGDIITFSPSETQQAKSFVARTPSMQGQSIIHTTWLSNPTFYTIFAPAGSLDPQVDQKHMVIVHDPKRPDTSADVFIPINFFPTGLRPPGAFTIALRGWDPAKILLLVGDSTTADIGLVCCTTDDKWQKLSFDEGAPSMPLDADQNETTMIGFELDLKNTTPYDVTTSTGETVSVPPPPVVWAYASDGTVTAWYVVNTRGTPYPSMAQATTLSTVSVPAAPAPTSPFSQAAQPAFGQTSPPAFGQPSQPSLAFSSGGSTFDQTAFGPASVPGPTFGQHPTFGNPGFTQTSAGSTFGQPSSSVQAPSGEGFAAFASAPVKWGQSTFGSTVSSFTSTAPPGSPPQIQIQPSESTESMSTDSGQELSFSGISLGEGTNDTQPKAGSGTTGIFGSPAPVVQSAALATTSAFGSGSFNLSPGVGAFAKYVPRQTGVPSVPTVEVPKPSPAFGQTGFGAPAFGQSSFGQSPGQSAFGKTGLGTPMSTTPIVTPVSTTSPSFGSGGALSSFASGGPATLSGSKPAETKLATPTMSGGGFGAFASSGPSAFGQAASTAAESVPAWKTGGDVAFGSGTGSSVFGGKSSTSSLVSAATPAKSLFASAEPAPSTTPAFSPPTTTSLEKATPSSAGATPLTPPSDGATPSRGSQSPPDDSTAPTSPLTAANLSKPTVPPESTTPAGPPPVPNAFMGLKMSTGFGLSNFNAKDSPFANPKPVSQTVSAFGGGEPPAPKVPVPATPGSVFGQTSTVGTAAKQVSAFGQPAFGSPSTPTAGAASTTPSSSQTGSSSAFSAFSGIASAFGKNVGSGVSFSDMLRHAGSSPDSKSKDTQAKTSLETGPSPPTPKSVFDKSPTPRPANIPAAPDSEDEREEEKGKARQVLSAESSFSNLSSSTSSFVDVPHGSDEEEGVVASDDDEQQIDEFLSGTDSESEGQEEEQEEDLEEEEEAPQSDDEENKLPTPAEVDPAAVPLPKSRSPSSTPKAERPAINVQPAFPPKPEPELSTSSHAGSTTPPGSPSTAPLQQPTPTLPSPSQTPSPSPSSTSSGLGRPSTRPLRSSPLANAPVSGGEEEEVKGEKPASIKPRPASPKTPFGKWDGSANAPSPMSPPESSVDQATKAVPLSSIPRPKSPPLLTTKGSPLMNKPASSLVTGPAATPPTPSSGWTGFSLGGPGLKPDTKSTAETPSLYAGIKPEPVTEASAALDSKAVPGPLFGTKPPAVSGTTASILPFAPATGPSSLGYLPGAIPGVMTPATSTNNVLTPSRTPGPGPGATSLITPPNETPSGEPMVPMQVEFAALYTEVLTEMAALTAFVRDARESRNRKMKPTSGRSAADTLEVLTKTIREFSRDIEQLELARNEDNATIRELEIGVLKAKTRKEEIARFDKARSDVEFGKMMKARILSPEQTELQTQLRRDMRSIQDRVTKMEDHLQGSKKRLNEFKTGKPSIKAPSLDTINRTSRNINIAIRQQSADITALSSRIAKLNIEGSPSSTPSRAHERDLVRRPLDVTPHVASTTAAALNAEQAARRLKEALLAVRTEPLLNKQAANGRPALRAFDTPQKPDADLASSGGSLSGRSFSTPITLPPLNVSDSAGRGVSPPLGRRSTQKHHAKSVPLKSTPTTGTTAKPAFDWGPLPGIKPMKTIASDLRSKTG